MSQLVDLAHPYLAHRTEKTFVEFMSRRPVDTVSVLELANRHKLDGPGSLLGVSAKLGLTISETPYVRTWLGTFSKACPWTDTANNKGVVCQLFVQAVVNAQEVRRISAPLVCPVQEVPANHGMFSEELRQQQDISAQQEIRHSADMRKQAQLRVELETRHSEELRKCKEKLLKQFQSPPEDLSNSPVLPCAVRCD